MHKEQPLTPKKYAFESDSPPLSSSKQVLCPDATVQASNQKVDWESEQAQEHPLAQSHLRRHRRHWNRCPPHPLGQALGLGRWRRALAPLTLLPFRRPFAWFGVGAPRSD